MKQILYPTPDQVDLAVRWANQGPRALSPDNGTARGSNLNPARSHNMVKVRDLIFRLSLPFTYETMRTEILYRPVNQVDRRLIRQIILSLRMHGYVYSVPAPPSADLRQMWPGAGVRQTWAAVPLTGHQLHVLRMYSEGMSTGEIAEFFGVDRNRPHKAMRSAAESLGLAGEWRGQIVGHAYRCGWLVTHAEHSRLMQADAVGKPYRTVSGPVTVPQGVTP